MLFVAKVVVRARKVGGSIMVRIPKEVVEEYGIKPGDLLEIEAKKLAGDWFGAFKDLRPFTREDELDAHE